jgi:hypothetical protein
MNNVISPSVVSNETELTARLLTVITPKPPVARFLLGQIEIDPKLSNKGTISAYKMLPKKWNMIYLGQFEQLFHGYIFLTFLAQAQQVL